MGVAITLVVLFAAIAIPFAVVRVNRRLGKSTISAGPTKVLFPPPPGQEQVPWELHSIVGQLPKSPTGQVGEQTVFTMNRLLDAAGLHQHGELPVNANVSQLQMAVTLLENHLGLSPLYEGVHLPSALQ